MLALVTPRLVVRSATRHRQLGLNAATFRRSNGALEKALRDGDHLTRDELAAALRSVGISTAGQRLAHLLARAELDALICVGARRGKQST
jgi:winged helix DNA-binding protein